MSETPTCPQDRLSIELRSPNPDVCNLEDFLLILCGFSSFWALFQLGEDLQTDLGFSDYDCTDSSVAIAALGRTRTLTGQLLQQQLKHLN